MNTTFLKILSVLGLALGATLPLFAQTSAYVNIDSGESTVKNLNNVTPLATSDIFQFGYYQDATTNNPFAGTFIALTSNGLAGSTATIIGGSADSGSQAGQFGYNLQFNLSNALLPQNGQIMALVFYNGTTVAGATAYGAASDAIWTWTNPTSALSDPQNFSLGDSGIVWLNNDAGFTGVAITGVPEPSAALLIVVGFLVLGVFRQRPARGLPRAYPAQR